MEAAGLPRVPLSPRALSDLQMISTGVFSPLEGFMGRDEYEGVVEDMRLESGLAWSLPITLSADEEKAGELSEGSEIALVDGAGEPVATMVLREMYGYDKEREARLVYRTTDADHPGVAAVYGQGDVLLGGEVELLRPPDEGRFPRYYYTPAQIRASFAEKGWKRIVGFQTRNPVHRAHEYIQKSALETVDGLLLNPLVGETKSDDIPADVRMRSYEVILDRYYPEDRTMLAVFPAAMRYAGPREAIFHAICRKNYGCSHFIVGPRPRRRRQLLRNLRRPAHLRGVRPGGVGDHTPLLRARVLLHGVRGHGLVQDLPPRPRLARLPLGNQGARDALQGRVPATRVLPPRSHTRCSWKASGPRAGRNGWRTRVRAGPPLAARNAQI